MGSDRIVCVVGSLFFVSFSARACFFGKMLWHFLIYTLSLETACICLRFVCSFGARVCVCGCAYIMNGIVLHLNCGQRCWSRLLLNSFSVFSWQLARLHTNSEQTKIRQKLHSSNAMCVRIHFSSNRIARKCLFLWIRPFSHFTHPCCRNLIQYYCYSLASFSILDTCHFSSLVRVSYASARAHTHSWQPK